LHFELHFGSAGGGAKEQKPIARMERKRNEWIAKGIRKIPVLYRLANNIHDFMNRRRTSMFNECMYKYYVLRSMNYDCKSFTLNAMAMIVVP
jgi:hypothetical protein